MAAPHTPTAEVEMSVPASTDSAADAPSDSVANMKLEVQQTGEPHAEWPSWYARYMVAEQTGEGLPS
jgi:hypothetical protein